MNVLFVNEYPFNPLYGGIERVTNSLAIILAQKYGHVIFYLVNKIDDDDILNYDFPAPIFFLPKGTTNERRDYVKALLRRHDIQVIINQRGQNVDFNKILKFDNVKLINVIHSQPSSFPFIDLVSPLRFEKNKLGLFKFYLKKISKPIYRIYRKWALQKEYSDIFTYVVKNSDTVVLLSENDKKELKRYAQIEKQKVIGIPNPNTYSIYNNELKHKEKCLLYVARLTKWDKNPMRLIKIWQHLYAKFPDWKLIIVGDGNMKRTMSEYVDKHLIERVIFEGAQKDVALYYKKASFILLTSNVEGWGMCLTEGMQYGCIPVTFNSYGGAKDIVDDEINGCLITPYSLTEYCNRLSVLMSDEQKRRRMALAAVEKVKQFDINIVAQYWDALISG